MNDSPLFSIIVASFNNSKYIPECLDSLINQTYSNIEIVVVDDASKDNSVEIIEMYKQKDKRIKSIYKKRNRGVGHTKMKGVSEAQGEIIGTIGADDALVYNAIELMVQSHLKNTDASLIYSTHYFCDNKLKIVGLNKDVEQVPHSTKYLTYSKYTSTTISSFRSFKKKYYDKTKGYSSYFKKAVDKDIIFKLEEVGKTLFINEPLYYYRLHDNNISRNKEAWKAKLWEVRAKEAAYKRRLGTNIPNITKADLKKEYYGVLKMLTSESLAEKKYIKYLKYIFIFIHKFKNPIQIAKFIYYTIKKHVSPSAFSS